MKTQRELNLKYWNDTYEMVEAYKKEHIGADVKPWQCVKYNGGTLCSHPDFRHHSTGGYEFAGNMGNFYTALTSRVNHDH